MKSANHTSLRVYEHIKNLMLNYEIVPGQKLIFKELARRLEVSRSPLNNACSLLAKEAIKSHIKSGKNYIFSEVFKK
jgi:DNA-binding GntR family transcriptional regulator